MLSWCETLRECRVLELLRDINQTLQFNLTTN